jgi:hypothetical protein
MASFVVYLAVDQSQVVDSVGNIVCNKYFANGR